MKELICIVCPQGCRLNVEKSGENYIVTGNTCKRGEAYAISEMTAPVRVITTTVCLQNSEKTRIPVKTLSGVPKNKIFDCMNEINKIKITPPINCGDILIENILKTGVPLVATASVK